MRSDRIESIGGGLRAGSALKSAIKKVVKPKAKPKPLAEPKSAVKVVAPAPKGMRKAMNDYSMTKTARVGSGKAAKTAESARAQNAAAIKKRAAAKDAAETARILAKGGKVVKQKPKGAFKNDVRVIK